jgi:DMSO/TMAO reductase YedYZ molybdopterin-dependent catalytic subunit
MPEHDRSAMVGREHWRVTRRYFSGLGSAAAAAWAAPAPADDARLREAIAQLMYLTPPERAFILDKGKADVTKLPPEKLRAIGLLPETWSLEVAVDTASGAAADNPFAFDWNGLMRLAEKQAVRFMHVTVCTNGADPYHTTLWEGVPLREVVWMARPKANIRRVYYQSYHPAGVAPFQASLPLGQVLETPPGQTPVVLAYRMNGQPIPASLGGPVRVVVPGAYGNKSIKWVRRLVLTNDHRANDSDADLNNDIDSPLKTRARFISVPEEAAARTPVALTGMAQVGISGLAKVQYSVTPQKEAASEADWKDAAILQAPARWGGGLTGGKLPAGVEKIDAKTGLPAEWPLRFAIAHWAALLPGLAPGTYDLCCRTIDLNGIAQPMPRPLLRTGVTAIQHVTLVVKG